MLTIRISKCNTIIRSRPQLFILWLHNPKGWFVGNPSFTRLGKSCPSLALNRGPASTDIASNSDKPTSQHSLDENRVYSVLLYCSRRIRFSSKGDSHEHIHRHDFLRQRLHNPRCVLGTLVADSRHPVRPLLHSRVLRLRPSAAGRRIGRCTGSLLRRRSHADSDRGRVLRLGCPQSHVVRGGAQDHPGGCGTRRLGRGGDRLQVPPSERFSSCSSRWSQPWRTRSPAREITCSHRYRPTYDRKLGLPIFLTRA